MDMGEKGCCLAKMRHNAQRVVSMGFLPDTLNCGLRMRRECRERFSRHRPQRKPLLSDPGMHHVTRVPWCMPGSLTGGGGENVSGIPGACANRNFTHLARDPWLLACTVQDNLVPWVPYRYQYTSIFHWHMEAETKWPPFRRRHFRTHFLEKKCQNFG